MPIAIMKVEDDRVAKFAEFKTTKQAQAHVDKFAERFPDAFVAPSPRGNIIDYRVENGALIEDPLPAPRQSVLTYEEFQARITAHELSEDAAIAFIDSQLKMRMAVYRAMARNSVNLDSPNTIAFVDALVAAGALDAAGKSAVLA